MATQHGSSFGPAALLLQSIAHQSAVAEERPGRVGTRKTNSIGIPARLLLRRKCRRGEGLSRTGSGYATHATRRTVLPGATAIELHLFVHHRPDEVLRETGLPGVRTDLHLRERELPETRPSDGKESVHEEVAGRLTSDK